MAYESLEPDPAEWTMHLMAQLVALTANIHRDQRARPRPYSAEEFLPRQPVSASEVETAEKWADTLAEMRANYAKRTN